MKIIKNDYVERFKSYLNYEEKASATVKKYISDVNRFITWVDGNTVGKEKVLEYKRILIEIYSPATVNSVLSSLNSFFSFLGWNECCVKMLKIQRKIFASRDQELTKGDYEKLLNAAQRRKNLRLYMLIQTICSTGIRVSELKYITAEAVTRGEAKINCKGKLRIIILTKQLCKQLKIYMRERGITKGVIFISRNGAPLDRSNIWSEMKKLCESAGVDKAKVFPHNLRHLFAKTYYTARKDIVRLADILGHTSVNTTRMYILENSDKHRKQIQALGLLRC